MSMELLQKAYQNSRYKGKDFQHFEVQDFRKEHEDVRKDWGLTKQEYDTLCEFMDQKQWSSWEEEKYHENEYGMFLGESPAIWHVHIPNTIIRMLEKRIKNSGEIRSDKNLRNKLIRLAHSKPELREHLLPLLKVAATKRDLEKLHALAKGIPNVGVFRVSDKRPKHFRHMHQALNGYSFDMDYKILDLTVYQQTTSRDQKKYRFFVDERGSDLMVADGDRFENPRVVTMAQAKKMIKAMEPEDKIPPGLIELLKREDYSYEIVGSDRVFVHAPMVDYVREDWEYNEAGLERWLKKEYNKLLRKMDKKIERAFPDILIQWHNEMLILRF